ncbi:hypothetical protein [Mycolicibacterium vaccae]|uniref:Uncharacterized protein n=1 Tax=Mycolicibacterium vaccae ATCC 25954 TaxID=1194972 RepID=K0UDC8_MYCVA|nr:hypothetical protein [Mycolicibacterium vaccae]EJZ04911.1 hypothetical protein MVAC_27129 [Mycolicibacterium vaccae ATCC 25954]
MCAAPARHRAARRGAPDSEWKNFWVAGDPTDTGRARSGRHARKTTPYSSHIGRVGALAVSLGVGLAVANSSGVAYADSDTESSVSSPGNDSVAPGPSVPGAADAAQDGETDATDEVDDDIDEIDDVDGDDETDEDIDDGEDVGDEDPDETDEASDLDPDPESEPPAEEAGAEDAQVPVESDGAPASAGQPSVPPRETEPTDELAGTVQDADTEESSAAESSGAATEVVPLTGAPSPEPTATQEITDSVGLFTAVVSNVVTPFADPDAPARAPWLDALLAWVRRQINHTFFNKSPIYGPITTEQIFTGQLLIDLHATDPNGDPLTYDIIQPEHGWVFRDIITGRFIYTPYQLVAGDPLQDSFQVVIRDDSEHPTGALGGVMSLLHNVARMFGLAQADNVTVTVPVFVDPVIQLPPLITPVAGLGYTLGGDAVKLVSSVLVADGDSDHLAEVIIKIATLAQDGDLLEYATIEGNPITATWDAQTKTLTLSGVATKAQYKQAIEAITFSATQGALLVRGVTISATDADGVDNIAPVLVAVAVLPALHLPPLVTPLPGLGYTLGEAPVKLVSAVDIADGDSSSLSKLVLKIATFAQSGDVLGYVAPSGNPITGSWDAETKTLTLSGVATKAQYEEALKAVTFAATQGALLARGVTISATDADGVDNIAPGFVTVGVWLATQLPPLVTPVGAPTHTLGSTPVKVVAAVDIADGDSQYLSEAVLKIALLGQNGDTLGYVAPSGNPVTGSWNAAARTLTLSGVATKAQYEEAIRAVTFAATQGAGIVRTITIDVTDDTGVQSLTSGVVLAGVRWSLPPLVTPVGAPTHTVGSAPVKLVSGVDIADGDSAYLSKAVLRIALLGQNGDTLGYVAPAGNPVTAVWDSGTRTLTLSGVATKAQYEAAIKAVTFSATQGVGIVRTITVDVSDDTGVQSLTSGIVLAGARNPLPPLVTAFGGRSYTVGKQPVQPISAVDIVDADSDYLTRATVEVTLFGRSGDVLQFSGLAGVPITASYDAGTRTLTLSGTATKAQYEAALKAITFTATGGSWTTRTLAVRVTDDAGVRSSAGLLTLSVW